MPKILHINDYPCEPATGGAEVVMARTCKLLTEIGLEVATFTGQDLPDRRRTAWRYLHNQLAANSLREKIRSFRPDVVHLHNYYHLLSPSVLGVLAEERKHRHFGVVMTLHDYHLICPNAGGHWKPLLAPGLRTIDPAQVDGLFYWLSRCWDARGIHFSLLKQFQHALHRRTLRRTLLPDVLICPSRFLQNLARPLVARTEYLPHPVPSLLPRNVVRSDRFRLVYVGRLEPEKGVAEFFRQIPDQYAAEFVVVGEGSQRTQLERIVAERKLNVRFLGRLPLNETHREIASSHVLIQPSKCLESYGLTLIEAFTFGTNVLASDRGGMREIVQSAGVGYLFDPDSPASLAQKLEEIARAFRSGTLNEFELDVFLRSRSESAYLQRLLDLYETTACGLTETDPKSRNREPRAA